MTREQIQTLYQTIGRKPPVQIDGDVWDEFFINRNPSFKVAFNLLSEADFIEIKISSWEFSRESVKAPWIKTQFDEWLKKHPLNGLTFKLSAHPRRRDRRQEGHLIDIDIPLGYLNNDQKAIFSDWFSRFSNFVKELPNNWSNTGLQWNSNNKEEIQKYLETFFVDEPQMNNPNDAQTRETGPTPAEGENSSNSNLGPRNLIYFGAPGTGKSHKLNRKVNEAFGDHRYERVTFYPTYSYSQFVGCYKPVMRPKVGGKPGEEEISYEFVPGPFLRVLVNALKALSFPYDLNLEQLKEAARQAGLQVSRREMSSTGKEHQNWRNKGEYIKMLESLPKPEYCLVIDEINRANAAAVFGDVFQLLDRGKNGDSEYEIAVSEDVKKFLQDEFNNWVRPVKNISAEKNNLRAFLKVRLKKDLTGKETGDWDSCRLRIPANMYIWATMNSADQGVFPMDTAFKRRWAFKYIGIDDSVSDDCKKWTIEGSRFLWNAVRAFLNDRLTDNGVNEDKLMGPWFVKPENGTVVSLDQFRSKVLMYLWEDAARMCRRKFFNDEIKTYSALVNGWPNVNVFKGIENWDEVKAKWIPSGPGAGMDGAGATEGTADPQTEAMPAATSTRTETPPSE